MTFKIHSIATICTVLLTTATAIHAQETSSPEVANPSIATESAKIDPQTIDKFTQAHSALLSIRQEFSQKLNSVTNQQEAETIQIQAQEKMIEAVEETGLSIEQYGEVVAMLQNNPELSERIFGNSRPVK
ncbi:DUF4168 domain-containing protein [Methylotuvimicrobium alcaliphilum]|uniref:DUF4168 domain-containing protein n=1 Tax=Methylotuvimicrobium alcaliphilum (strain DSM 19304 / NCIMB 14124 / VKM B-2133 / 20Z) TaxID=1091494 RepID=G4T1Y8_META2|nr:DUF4168 domain-containing protein [Methylotuvimicrobium alcaliphilum]CCE24662.1 conserved exported protein of unknown function [Methylotuvimicrobium alcaliphilum 20Z]